LANANMHKGLTSQVAQRLQATLEGPCCRHNIPSVLPCQ